MEALITIILAGLMIWVGVMLITWGFKQLFGSKSK
jgi:hypothetical protein